MKKIILPAIFLLTSLCIQAQTTNIIWAKNLKYSTANDASQSNDLVIDNAGNYYITGMYDRVLDMDPGTGTYTVSSLGNYDAFIAKYTPAGNLIWAKSLGTAAGPDEGKALHIVNNTLYIGGAFWGTTFDADPSASTYTLAGGASNTASGFVATFDTSGTFQSAFSIPQCPVYAIKTDGSGNIYIGGRFLGDVDLDPGPGVYPVSSVTSSGVSTWDAYYGKYTASGNMIWANTKGSSSSESTNGLSIDPISGNVAVACTYNGIYVALTNSSGTIIKEANIGSGLASDAIFDNTGNLYFTGVYSTSSDFDWSAASTYTLPANSTVQAFVMKYNSANTFIWAKQIPLVSSINYATGPAMNLDNNNDILITNREYNAASASWLVFMKLYKNNGTTAWRNDLTGVCYNGNNNNEGTGIAYSSIDQTIMVTGVIGGSSVGSGTPCSFDADPGSGVYTLNAGVGNTSNHDVFMGKYGSCAGVPSNIPAISGSTVQCAGGTTVYSVSPVSGANSYNWSLPGGWTGSSTSNTISATASSSGTITVEAVNSCGSSTLQSLPVQVNPVPAQPSAISGAISFCNGAGAQTYSIAAVSGASSYTWSLPGGWTGSSASNTIQVMPNATSGVLSVAAINGCGTGSANSLSITVNALPSVAVNGPSAVCSGNQANLTATGANTYTWNTGSNSNTISEFLASDANYTVTGTDVNGCVNAAVKSVSVNALPSVAISGNTTVCMGFGTSLTATGATSYTWSTNATTSTVSVSPTSNTTYSVIGEDVNGCTGTVFANVVISPSLSISINGPSFLCEGSSITLDATGADTYTWNTGATTNSINVSPSAFTTYTITGTDINGCTGTAFKNIAVNPLPPVAINGTTVICEGNNVNLTASGADTYTWSTSSNSSSISVNPTANTSYTVTGTNSSGCDNSAVSSITVNALPAVSVSATSTLLCSGESATLTASGATTYTWSTGTTGTSETVSSTGNSTYTLSGTDASNCENMATITLSVSACTGIEVLGKGAVSLTLFPNPVSNELNIGSSEIIHHLEITDITGKMVYVASNLETLDATVNTENYSNGIYTVTIHTDKQVKHLKFVKK